VVDDRLARIAAGAVHRVVHTRSTAVHRGV
jgi:hypothetical protein